MSYQQWIDMAGKPYRDAAAGDPRDAELARLRARLDELTADAIVRAHRQCIALEALAAIRDNTALPQTTRLIAARALVEIEAVQP